MKKSELREMIREELNEVGQKFSKGRPSKEDMLNAKKGRT